MSKIKSRPSVRPNPTEIEADIERWRVAGAELRAKHPRLFEELVSLARCAIREYEAGESFEAHIKLEGFTSRLATAHRIGGAS